MEVFGTTATDIVLPVHRRNKPIALGQVGVRCQRCRDVNPVGGRRDEEEEDDDDDGDSDRSDDGGGGGDRGRRSPRVHAMNGIYNVVQQMYRLHFDA